MNARRHRVSQARRESLVERTQRFINDHPEMIPEPMSYKSVGFDKCIVCGCVRPKEEMLGLFCGFGCAAHNAANNRSDYSNNIASDYAAGRF